MIYVGIDIASEKHDYFMIQAETGTVYRSAAITISNSDDGYKKLHSDISVFCRAAGDSFEKLQRGWWRQTVSNPQCQTLFKKRKTVWTRHGSSLMDTRAHIHTHIYTH